MENKMWDFVSLVWAIQNAGNYNLPIASYALEFIVWPQRWFREFRAQAPPRRWNIPFDSNNPI